MESLIGAGIPNSTKTPTDFLKPDPSSLTSRLPLHRGQVFLSSLITYGHLRLSYRVVSSRRPTVPVDLSKLVFAPVLRSWTVDDLRFRRWTELVVPRKEHNDPLLFTHFESIFLDQELFGFSSEIFDTTV